MTTLLILLLIAITVIPLSKITFDRVSSDVAANQYELLLAAVRDAVNHVEQITTVSDEETSSEAKKELAIEIATKIAQGFDIPAKHHALISDLIESYLWKEEQDEADEDDFE